MSDTTWTTCPWKGCGYSPFPMATGYYERTRRTGETFYCPDRHAIVFNGGKTADEKEIERLNRVIGWRDNDITHLKVKVDLLQRQCPWQGCSFMAKSWVGRGLHMQRIHGMPTWAEVEAELGASE